MAIKKQLKDKDGNTIYPDVGLDLDSVVYSDDPTEPIDDPTPWITNNEITDNTIESSKINHQQTKTPFLVYEYVQSAQSTSDVTIDVPVDLITYRGYIIEVNFEPCNTNQAWVGYSALDSSKTSIQCRQRGFEFNPSYKTISRDTGEIIAGGANTENSSKFKIQISRSNTVNYPCFYAQGFGGGEIYCQQIVGRVLSSSGVLKYIRCILKSPQKNSCVRAYAYY